MEYLIINKVLQLYNNKILLNEISEVLDISLSEVLTILEENVEFFKYTGASRFLQLHIKEILIDYVDNGLSSKVIAKKYGHCSKTVLRILHDNHLKLRLSGTQKIFEKDSNQIINIYKNKIPIKTIALLMNVSQSAITRCLKKQGIEVEPFRPTTESRQAHRKYHFDMNYFKFLDTADKTYFLGLFAADGGFVKKNNALMGITIGLKESSSEILKSFLSYIKSNATLKNKHTKYTYKGKTRYLNQKAIEIHSKNLAFDVKQLLELPDDFYKTFDLVYPSTIPFEFESHFCRGIFDGDGTLNLSNNNISFYGTKLLLEGIRKAICRNCPVSYPKIKAKITTTSKSDNHLYELNWGGKIQILKILDWIYKDTNTDLYIAEKYQQYKSINREKTTITITELISIEEIILIRRNLGLSQSALAKAISCNPSLISDLECKKRNTMTTIFAKRLLDFYGINYKKEFFYY